jgi:hypothetical protein
MEERTTSQKEYGRRPKETQRTKRGNTSPSKRGKDQGENPNSRIKFLKP